MIIFPKSKKAVAPLFVILGFIAVLIIIYLVLFIPIPAFTSIRTQVNYFLILAFWILLQVGIILAYFELGKYVFKGINILRFKVIDWSLKLRNHIIRHS